MQVSIRQASLEDIDALVQLRLALVQESGHLMGTAQITTVKQAIRQYFLDKLPTGEFLVWIVEVEGQIVATSGLIFFQKPPSEKNLSGLEAYVLNMYTLPMWRGKGFATLLLQEITSFVKETPARRIFLYATTDGKPIYEKAGFVPKKRQTLEMEFTW